MVKTEAIVMKAVIVTAIQGGSHLNDALEKLDVE